MADIRIISRENGVGLSKDMRLIAGVLSAAGHRVELLGYTGSQVNNRWREVGLWCRRARHGQVDVQIFVERVYRRCLPLARRNVLIPNPEWFLPKWRPHLGLFDRVVCKTRHAESIFVELGCPTAFSGFTSEDLFDPDVPRERSFFHLAGRSATKGTQVLLAAWRRHPHWPMLTVVQHPKEAKPGPAAANIAHLVGVLDASELRRLQNAHAFHLCPSEAEGFGHYIMEGLGVGAVVLTTDAAPMNELVTPERGLLIAPVHRQRRGLVDFASVDEAGIEKVVERALAMNDAQCEAIGAAARAYFMASDREFRLNLETACLRAGDGSIVGDDALARASRP